MMDFLVKEREAIRGSLDAQANDMRNLVKNTETGDEVDAASDAVDRALLNSLSAQDAKRLEQIDSAITRIKQGNYGICVRCGQEIPSERLKALPFAIMCVKCASNKR